MKTKFLIKFDDFTKRTAKWKLFLIFIPVYFVVFFVCTYIMFAFVPPAETIKNYDMFIVDMSVLFSILFSLVTVLLFSMSDKSDKFWSYARDFEKILNDSKTKKELEKIYNDEFEELKKLSQGGAHNSELHRLKSMMDIKYNLIN